MVNVRGDAHSYQLPAMWANRTVTNLMTGEQVELKEWFPLQPYQYLLFSYK